MPIADEAAHNYVAFGPYLSLALLPVIAFTVTILTPKFEDGRFSYRDHVFARVSLIGGLPPCFTEVVLGSASPTGSELGLRCSAKCDSCSSSLYPQCCPTYFCLVPVHDSRHSQGLELDRSSCTLTGNVTFKIPHRPRKPKSQDQMWRCASESLT